MLGPSVQFSTALTACSIVSRRPQIITQALVSPPTTEKDKWRLNNDFIVRVKGLSKKNDYKSWTPTGTS